MIKRILDAEVIAPKGGHGVNWGVKGRVLVQRGGRKLIWRKGHMTWSSRGQQRYSETSLKLEYYGEWRDILEGGRFSPSRLTDRHMQQIREWLGIGEQDLQANELRLGQTIDFSER